MMSIFKKKKSAENIRQEVLCELLSALTDKAESWRGKEKDFERGIAMGLFEAIRTIEERMI